MNEQRQKLVDIINNEILSKFEENNSAAEYYTSLALFGCEPCYLDDDQYSELRKRMEED